MSGDTKKILIVEDEEALLDVLAEKLSGEGYFVLKSKNGAEGLDEALKNHPDLIILDIFMPIMNGIDMLKKLRDDTWGKHVPVIIFTNLESAGQIQELAQLGVLYNLVKSETRLEDLLSKVDRFFESGIPHQHKTDPSNFKVLITEDEAPLLNALVEKFTKERFTVFSAADGAQGLETAKNQRPDIILLDIRMPVMDGIEMLSEIRKLDWGKKVYVYMLTNSEDSISITKSFGLKVNAYFIKSDLRLEDVVSTIKSHLGILDQIYAQA